PFDDGTLGADDGGVETGNTETALFFELHPFAHHELGVDHHDQPVWIVTERDVHDEDPQRHADLGRRKPDARRRVHRVNHVGDDTGDVCGDAVDGSSGLVQDLIT